MGMGGEGGGKGKGIGKVIAKMKRRRFSVNATVPLLCRYIYTLHVRDYVVYCDNLIVMGYEKSDQFVQQPNLFLQVDLLLHATSKCEKCITTLTEIVVVWSFCSTCTCTVNQRLLRAPTTHTTVDSFASDVARSCKTNCA